MSTESSRFRISRADLLGLLVIICVLAGLLIPAIQAVRVASSFGRAIPSSLPDATRRVVHDKGMSIVVPPNWRRTVYRNERDDVLLEFHGGGRYPSRIWVEQIAADTIFQPISDEWDFQGQILPCRTTIRDAQTWDDWRYYQRFQFEAVIELAQERYILGFKTHENVHELPQSVNRYLQEVRLTTKLEI